MHLCFYRLKLKSIFEWENEFGLRAMEAFLYIWLQVKLWWILQYLSLWLSRLLKTEVTSIFSQDILPLSHLTSERRHWLKAMCAFSSRNETAFRTRFWHVYDLKRMSNHQQCIKNYSELEKWPLHKRDWWCQPKRVKVITFCKFFLLTFFCLKRCALINHVHYRTVTANFSSFAVKNICCQY